ncbi:hypothetical protein Pan216_23540 [Planctomycetes bacterium Pan216]|uniref:Uncharacterized protein n=1 Tax=Kolteria novifilia TaxID=2527975 RepID=A0A518B3C1_9BACT|nr:hypothetical protein Pan216_23540 [Planctomycetes bacterium Pan216]
MRNRFTAFGASACLGLGVLLVPGCGGSGSSSAPKSAQAVVPESDQEIRKYLLNIAESGEAGSALQGLSSLADKLAETDPEKAKKLKAGVRRMDGAGSPEAVKKVASELAGEFGAPEPEEATNP